MSNIVKTSINLPKSTLAELERISKRTGKTMSQIIRESISTGIFLQKSIDDGGKILIEESDKSINRLVFR